MYYDLRHHGLRRKNKPWAGASDAHFPISDTIISNLKPYYVQQLFALDTVASFVSLRDQGAAVTTAAGQWFDFKLKQRTNIQMEIISVIDSMLVSGRAAVKTTWSESQKRVVFENVDPMNLVVPEGTKDLESADRITHIQHYSQESYRRHKHLSQNKAIIDQITGGNTSQRGDDQRVQSKYSREGITYSDDNTIIVWETYVQESDGEWEIYTYSPTAPQHALRPPMRVPFKHGKPPFTSFQYEIKDAGWYSPRGVVELVAVFETALTKLLNEKNDAMSLYNRPLFKGSRALPNTANLRFQPGQILPEDIQPISMPSPPISFDQHMVLYRDMAQQRVSTPDFGITQTLDDSSRRTATEISAIGNLFSQSADLRMRTFRMQLSELYRQCWSIMIDRDKKSLDFYYQDNLSVLPSKALHTDYEIVPSGSADGVNKQFHFQKAVGRFQMFANDAFIDQSELRKSVLEADDSALVKRLLVDPQQKASEEAEAQAMELMIMRDGFPAAVSKADDHQLHVRTMLDYIALKTAEGAELTPLFTQRFQEHLAAHIEVFKEDDPKAARELAKEVKELSDATNQAAQSSMAPEQAGGIPQDPAMVPSGGPGVGEVPVQ